MSKNKSKMKLHELRPAKGATHKVKRIGRGDGSGHGGTSTKGTKGAQAVPVIKEKWHMKVARCLFSVVSQNVASIILTVLNIRFLILDRWSNWRKNMVSQKFSLENLYINGLISQTDKVKILGNGELKSKFTFKVNAVSEKAKAAIEAAGGYN